MRIIDVERDRRFYNEECTPETCGEDPLSLWRHALLCRLLKRRLKTKALFADEDILNVAGGWGREARILLRHKPRALILCDYSHTQLEYAKGYLKEPGGRYFICADGQRLPFKDKSVDICVIAEGLHHFLDPIAGIKEMARVARKMVILDEPGGGFFRKAVNNVFVRLGIKERLERGYLQEYRISKKIFNELDNLYPDIIYFPYFIYYFGWYKNTKNLFLKKVYQAALCVVNIFFHALGNRTIAVLILAHEEHK